MLANLKKEMWGRKVTGRQIADLIGVTQKAVSSKIHCHTEFTRSEMFLIWDRYFSDIDMAYLFEKE